MGDTVSRRDFVKTGMSVSAATLAGCAPLVHAGGQEATLKIGLVGCGGRGTGAAENCMNSAKNVQLVALGDMFADKIKTARKNLSAQGHDGYKVQDDTCFSGPEAYKKVIDAVDLVLFATPPGFRPIHLAAAVEAGKHVFIEKPVAVDPVGIRKVIEAGEKAKAKKVAVVAGTQYRHQTSFMETIKRIHEGAIGKIISGRAYYNTGTLWSKPRTKDMTDTEYQLRNWLYFDYLSGDHFVEQHIHTIDVTDWAMGAHPVKAVGVGGRQVRTGNQFGNVYDHFAVDYEYPDGRHVTSMARQFAQTPGHVGAYFEGADGEANVYAATISGKNAWKFDGKISIADAYIREHTDLVESIRSGKPLNEAAQVAQTTLTAIMGREAAYTGKVVTWEEMEKSDLVLAPTNMEKLEFGPVAIRPVPMPGQER